MHGCHRPVLEGRPCGVSRRFHRAASFIARICSRRYHLQRMHGTIADVSLQLSQFPLETAREALTPCTYTSGSRSHSPHLEAAFTGICKHFR